MEWMPRSTPYRGGHASPRFRRSLQLCPSLKSLSCCVRNVLPKQKAFLPLRDFYIWMEMAYRSEATLRRCGLLCGSGLRFAVPGPREFCTFYPTNPHRSDQREARHRMEALLLSRKNISRTHRLSMPCAKLVKPCNEWTLCIHLPSVRQKPKPFLKGHFLYIWPYLLMTLLLRILKVHALAGRNLSSTSLCQNKLHLLPRLLAGVSLRSNGKSPE